MSRYGIDISNAFDARFASNSATARPVVVGIEMPHHDQPTPPPA
jgi:hypothetical protein